MSDHEVVYGVPIDVDSDGETPHWASRRAASFDVDNNSRSSSDDGDRDARESRGPEYCAALLQEASRADPVQFVQLIADGHVGKLAELMSAARARLEACGAMCHLTCNGRLSMKRAAARAAKAVDTDWQARLCSATSSGGALRAKRRTSRCPAVVFSFRRRWRPSAVRGDARLHRDCQDVRQDHHLRCATGAVVRAPLPDALTTPPRSKRSTWPTTRRASRPQRTWAASPGAVSTWWPTSCSSSRKTWCWRTATTCMGEPSPTRWAVVRVCVVRKHREHRWRRTRQRVTSARHVVCLFVCC